MSRLFTCDVVMSLFKTITKRLPSLCFTLRSRYVVDTQRGTVRRPGKYYEESLHNTGDDKVLISGTRGSTGGQRNTPTLIQVQP